MTAFLCASCGELLPSTEAHGMPGTPWASCGPTIEVSANPGAVSWCDNCDGFFVAETAYLHESCVNQHRLIGTR